MPHNEARLLLLLSRVTSTHQKHGSVGDACPFEPQANDYANAEADQDEQDAV